MATMNADTYSSSLGSATIECARKVLGEKGRKMTDKEIEGLINTLILVCDKTIDRIVDN